MCSFFFWWWLLDVQIPRPSLLSTDPILRRAGSATSLAPTQKAAPTPTTVVYHASPTVPRSVPVVQWARDLMGPDPDGGDDDGTGGSDVDGGAEFSSADGTVRSMGRSVRVPVVGLWRPMQGPPPRARQASPPSTTRRSRSVSPSKVGGVFFGTKTRLFLAVLSSPSSCISSSLPPLHSHPLPPPPYSSNFSQSIIFLFFFLLLFSFRRLVLR